eukprot:TRINITY_DN3527_c0_g1_i1.p1 TRINITY_DN3527_c0_g1~~TRINITY_DN3527_c0_g1_i1.p1  ORF type:complete len:713 (+),score=86.98 TRINITY_DN3527_c0_g1_i1:25-2139(+)
MFVNRPPLAGVLALLSPSRAVCTTSNLVTFTAIPMVKPGQKRLYEVYVVNQRGCIQFGWCETNFAATYRNRSLSSGVGGYTGTYGMDSLSGSIGTGNTWKSFRNQKIRKGDHVACAIDLVDGTITYFVNGIDLGIAFRGLDTSCSYCPMFSLKYPKTEVYAIFSGNTYYSYPSSYSLLAQWVGKRRQECIDTARERTRKNETDSLLLRLPDEILIAISRFLSGTTLVRLFSTCSKLKNFVGDTTIWLNLLNRDFYLSSSDVDLLENDVELREAMLEEEVEARRNEVALVQEARTRHKKLASERNRQRERRKEQARRRGHDLGRESQVEVEEEEEYEEEGSSKKEKGRNLKKTVALNDACINSEYPLVRAYQNRVNWKNGNFTSVASFIAGEKITRWKPVQALQLDSDILVLSSRNSLKFYDAYTYRLLEDPYGTIKLPFEILTPSFNQSILVCGGASGKFCVLNLDTAEIEWSQTEMRADVETVSLSHSGDKLLTGDWDLTVNLWSVDEARHLHTIEKAHRVGEEGRAVNVAKFVSHGEDVIVTGGYDGYVNFFDFRVGDLPVSQIHKKGAIVNDISFRRDSEKFAIGCENGGVLLYDWRRLKNDSTDDGFLLHVRSGQNRVKALKFDGRFVVSGGFSDDCICWDVRENRHCFSIDGPSVTALDFNLHQLVLGSPNGRVRWYDFHAPPEDWSLDLTRYYTSFPG